MQLLLKQLGIDAERTTGTSGGGPLEMWILEGTHPSKSNVQAARCTREVNRAARWVGNVANIQC